MLRRVRERHPVALHGVSMSLESFDGAGFGTLCERLAQQHGAGAGPALAGAWLDRWLREGLIAGVDGRR